MWEWIGAKSGPFLSINLGTSTRKSIRYYWQLATGTDSLSEKLVNPYDYKKGNKD